MAQNTRTTNAIIQDLLEESRKKYPKGKPLDETMKRFVYTLNTWTEDKKDEVRKYLEEGYFVHMGSNCLGHSKAQAVAYDGLRWVVEEYGRNVMIREDDLFRRDFVALR